MTLWHYHYAGLQVTSELMLPEWQIFECPQPFDAPDVRIRLDRDPPVEHPWFVDAEQLHFRIEEVADFWVTDGREIRVALHPEANEREARLFLLGSAWGGLCYQRKILVLHCSVINVDGHAIAFSGASGAGKSSIVAWLARRGYALLGDDLCHVELTDDTAYIFPAAPRLKLWRSALEQLELETMGLARDHFRMDKYHVTMDDEGPFAACHLPFPLPLHSFYLLDWGDLAINRLTGLAALHQLVESATYRGELLRPMDQVAAHWERCAALAHAVAIHRFTRPREWSAMARVMDCLMEHVSDSMAQRPI